MVTVMALMALVTGATNLAALVAAVCLVFGVFFFNVFMVVMCFVLLELRPVARCSEGIDRLQDRIAPTEKGYQTDGDLSSATVFIGGAGDGCGATPEISEKTYCT